MAELVETWARRPALWRQPGERLWERLREPGVLMLPPLNRKHRCRVVCAYLWRPEEDLSVRPLQVLSALVFETCPPIGLEFID